MVFFLWSWFGKEGIKNRRFSPQSLTEKNNLTECLRRGLLGKRHELLHLSVVKM